MTTVSSWKPFALALNKGATDIDLSREAGSFCDR